MLRFIYVIIMRIFSIMYFVPQMRKYAKHPDKYSEEDCLELAKIMIRKVAKTSRIKTTVQGIENLPLEGGYVLVSNHQSKFDALGIIETLPKPCRVLMDLERSQMPLANEFVNLMRGKRLDKANIRQQVMCFREMTEEIKGGCAYLIFPEGGYVKRQTNVMHTFYAGCFRTAVKADCPIVPIALVDSYKTFGRNSLRRVEVQIHFLPPILPEVYHGMTTTDLARMAETQIAERISQVTGEEVAPTMTVEADK